MAYFDCIVGGSGKGNTLVVTCADDLAGATITCTNGTKTYTKTCPSTAPYEVTFYGLAAGTYTVSATVSGDTYTTTVVVADYEAELGGFNWKAWVDLSKNYTSTDFTDLDELLDTELAVRELMSIHACVDYLAGIAAESVDVETIISNDLCAKWINNRDYALDTLYANTIIKGYMDTADKYFYGEWCLISQVPKMTSNTAPYGEVIYSNQRSGDANKAAWHAFDGDTTRGIYNYWQAYPIQSYEYIGYKFPLPIVIEKAVYILVNLIGMSIVLQGSNDNSTWVDLTDVRSYTSSEETRDTALPTFYVTKNKGAYLYYRFYCSNFNGGDDLTAKEILFYAWQPKGNVPIMTANNAPYGEASADSTSDGTTFPAWKVFDGNVSTLWQSVNSAFPHYIGYTSPNPICVRRVSFVTDRVSASSTGSNVKRFEVRGSNDGFATYDVIYSGTAENVSDWRVQAFDFDNDKFYLSHRLHVLDSYDLAYSYYCDIRSLQFYGRELSVSVPAMTSDTAPYGEAIKSSEYNESFPAWKAFSPTETYGWVSSASSLTNAYVGYEFTTSCVVKAIWAKSIGAGALTDIKLQGYDGTDWNDLLTFSLGQNVTKLEEVTNSTEYESYRVIGTFNMGGQGVKFQFYGLDYSEKEFETGTTKKWLYDHGVELESITIYNQSGNAAKKMPDYLYCDGSVSGNNKIAFMRNIDLTNYELLRAKAGDYAQEFELAVYDGEPYYGKTAIASTVAVATDLPNNIGLSVDAINQAYNVCVRSVASNKTSCKELWLE